MRQLVREAVGQLRRVQPGRALWFWFGAAGFDSGNGSLVLGPHDDDPDAARFAQTLAGVQQRLGRPEPGPKAIGVIEFPLGGPPHLWAQSPGPALLASLADWVKAHAAEHPELLRLVGSIWVPQGGTERAGDPELWRGLLPDEIPLRAFAAAQSTAATVGSARPGDRLYYSAVKDAYGADQTTLLLCTGAGGNTAQMARDQLLRAAGWMNPHPAWANGAGKVGTDGTVFLFGAPGAPNLLPKLVSWVDTFVAFLPDLAPLRTLTLLRQQEEGHISAVLSADSVRRALRHRARG